MSLKCKKVSRNLTPTIHEMLNNGNRVVITNCLVDIEFKIIAAIILQYVIKISEKQTRYFGVEDSKITMRG